MQPTKCEACGGEVEFRREGSVQGFYCKNCDWAVVTTYIPKIETDETQYQVRVFGGDSPNEAQIRAVSVVSGLNFIVARKLLHQEKPLVFEGEATKVVEVRNKLANAGLRLEISPQFNY